MGTVKCSVCKSEEGIYVREYSEDITGRQEVFTGNGRQTAHVGGWTRFRATVVCSDCGLIYTFETENPDVVHFLKQELNRHR